MARTSRGKSKLDSLKHNFDQSLAIADAGKKDKQMTTVLVTYSGDAATRFDRQYYVEKHLPLVTQAWGPHGLQSIAAFFPSGEGAGTIAICVCQFRDDSAVTESIHASETKSVMDDVPHFTSATPTQLRVEKLRA